jgi:DNA repair photolyase
MAGSLRWPLADQPPASGQLALFNDVVEHHFGTGEFRGLEFLHVNAKRIINEVPSASRMPFRFTINAYRGCSHACSYCTVGDAQVLLADGGVRRMADLRTGDAIIGTVADGLARSRTPATVLDHWQTTKPAFLVALRDGTDLVTSGDHRVLTDRGWRHVARGGPRLERGDVVLSGSRRSTRVAFVESLNADIPLFDITTTTGDYVADGAIHHNCFARPTHDYLGLDTGRDFETKIVVKINAVEKLRAELRDPRWQGDTIAMGTNTDPYQRCEGKYRLTRGIIEVLGQHGNPFSILTKGTLILRDLDVLVEAAKQTDVRTSFSIGTLDPDVWRAAEPGTPHPQRRVEAVAKLNEAGIPCNVLIAPIIPGLSDSPEQLEAVTAACVKAGASVTPIVLHLRPGVREEFMPWLEQYRPELAAEYQQRYSRSYIDKGYQDRITALVHEFARANRPSQARV